MKEYLTFLMLFVLTALVIVFTFSGTIHLLQYMGWAK